MSVSEVMAPDLTVLHVGCGRRKTLDQLGLSLGYPDGTPYPGAITLVNLDMRETVQPDLVCELGKQVIRASDNSFDAVVAMHILEHIGQQGQLKEWFFAFEELYRVLKPNGVIRFECPYATSIWAWADPTHTRAISEYAFLYFNQDAYREKGSAIPDYRPKFDFILTDWKLKGDTTNPEVYAREGETSFMVGSLVARKPFRPYWEDR